MVKLYVLSTFLLLHSVAVLSIYIPEEERAGNGNNEPIYSGHIPYHLAPMNLTTGELKLFAGHSMQFLKAKCPAVNKDSLTQISRYIAKLVSKTNPVPERSPNFDKLLTSISSCAMRDSASSLPEEEKTDAPTSFFHSFLTPFIRIRGFFSPGEDEKQVATSTVSPTTAPPTDKDTTSEQKQDGVTKIMGKSMIKGDESDSAENIESSTASSADKNQVSDDAEFFHVSQPSSSSESETASDSDSDSSWMPTNWIRNIFHVVRDYFHRIFGSENVEFSGGTVSYRAKRDLSESQPPAATDNSEKAIESESDFPAPKQEKKSVDKVTIMDNTNKGNKGKRAFLQLMDNLCRVYCSQCHDKTHIMEFKSAAKALLKFVYEDPTGIDLAAKHYLDPAVFEALQQCQ